MQQYIDLAACRYRPLQVGMACPWPPKSAQLPKPAPDEVAHNRADGVKAQPRLYQDQSGWRPKAGLWARIKRVWRRNRAE
jgi:hypothetical protein